MSAKTTYLGDGVYADFTAHGDLKIWTSDGIKVTHGPIVLEPEVYDALKRYVERHEQKQSHDADKCL